VCFFGYFLCTSKESDSRKARNAFSPETLKARAKSQIKSTPPQSSPALRAREEAEAGQAEAEAAGTRSKMDDQPFGC
jgi:hypothetical protein